MLSQATTSVLTNLDETSKSDVNHSIHNPDPLFSAASAIFFSAAQLELFERRFENGYNLYTDVEYVKSAQSFHPESVPSLGTT